MGGLGFFYCGTSDNQLEPRESGGKYKFRPRDDRDTDNDEGVCVLAKTRPLPFYLAEV